MNIEVEFLPWLGERLGGATYRSQHLIWPVEVKAEETVAAIFGRLAAAEAGFRAAVYDPEQACLNPLVVVVLNDRLLDLAGGLAARLKEGDRLVVVPALVGG